MDVKQKLTPKSVDMKFRYEKDMTPVVESWLLEQGYLVKKEVYMGWSVVDIIGCKINAEKGKLRIKNRQSSYQHLSFTKYGVSKDDPIEKGYERGNFYDYYFDVKHIEPKSFQWYPLQDDLIMIELKLKNLRVVIEQAETNTLSCDRSYIAMPDYSIKRFTGMHWSMINNADVGVISVGESCEIIKEPASNGTKNKGSEFSLVEKFWTLYKKNQLRGVK